MYRIGEFSKLCRISVKNLRYYDEIQLLKPQMTDPESGYRYYTTRQLIQVHEIQSYRQLGLSINEIKQILMGKELAFILENRKQELMMEEKKIQEQLNKIKLIQGQDMENLYNYKAMIKEIPEYIIYAKKMRISDYSEYFTEIPALGEAVSELNPTMQCAVPEYNYVVYLDGEYKEEDRLIEFCEAVTKIGTAPEKVEFRKTKPLTVVSVMHKGPYESLGLAYAFAADWLEKNHYILADNPRESFIDGIWNKDSEDEWLTEIQLPILREGS